MGKSGEAAAGYGLREKERGGSGTQVSAACVLLTHQFYFPLPSSYRMILSTMVTTIVVVVDTSTYLTSTRSYSNPTAVKIQL